MPRNRRESFIFTIMMCAFMVFTMSVYNTCMANGFSWESVKLAWLGLPLAYMAAFFCDWFLVARPAKKAAAKIAGPKSKIIFRIIAVSTCMVCGMVVLMSLFGALNAAGFSRHALILWPRIILMNVAVALPLQLLLAGPLVRFVFGRLVIAKNIA